MDLSREIVASYLNQHPDFLDEYVSEHVDVERVERWVIRRSQREKKVKPPANQSPTTTPSGRPAFTRKTSLSRWKFCVHADKRQMLQTLMKSLAVQPQPYRIMWELACCIASAVSAEGFILHVIDPFTGQLRIFKRCNIETDPDTDTEFIFGRKAYGQESNVTPPLTLASYVAQHKRTVVVTDCRSPDHRFPNGSSCAQDGGIHILAAPVVQSDGTLTAVLELYRRQADHLPNVANGQSMHQVGEFHEEDEEIVDSYLVWGGIALHYSDLYHALNKQRILHQFLLTVVKSIFQDMVSMDPLIVKIMDFAQKLVDADRASLFLVDKKSRELYARIFDMGDGMTEAIGHGIRFPMGTGIAGQVALSGEVLNITDAYSDPRFNRTVDQKTGYRTKTILCMPIFIRGDVIGVVQMVNKRHGTFTNEDEESFKVFADYCGLAIHHAKLYDRISRKKQKYRVALEVLSYHNCCSDDEIGQVITEPIVKNAPIDIDKFWFDQFSVDDLQKVRSAVFMFVDLFGLAEFDIKALTRFCLTVRKNYRRVPYHNWTHGFAVANSMYAILKQRPNTFTRLESIALFIGSLCHDLDHRGKNNKFMLDTESPLASIYTTSTMEHHHFNQTVTILQQQGHNILNKFDDNDYKQVLRNIKHCILATDLAVFFSNRAKLAELVDKQQFSWQTDDHRLLVEAIAMTASDLCASAKPWDIQAKTVEVIFEEFYQQGDAEREAGRIPIPMMDRTQVHLQPDSQVQFISEVCIPCYKLLYHLIPETKPLLDGVQTNLSRWRQLKEENERCVTPESPDSMILPPGRPDLNRSILTRTVSLPVTIDLDVA